MKLIKLFKLSIFCAFWLIPSVAAANTLSLLDVLKSVDATHPELGVARASVEEARGGILVARGAFDLKAYAEGGYAPLGKYDKSHGAVGLVQPTTLSGLEIWTRYENGVGFPPYEGAQVTSEAGRASLGIVLPLLRGRSIDEGRLGRVVSELSLSIAEEQLRQTRASLLAEAASVWWKWVITGRKLEAYDELVFQAEERKKFLEEQVKAGAIPRVELLDNLRVLSGRRAQHAALGLEFRQLSLTLGLFRRTESGAPLRAKAEELPALPPIEAFDSRNRDKFAKALRGAPARRIYEIASEIAQKELTWAQNQTLPELNLELYSSQSFGAERPYSATETSLTETTAGGKVKLYWDVQRRKARGKAQVLRAKLSALSAKNRQLTDKLEAAFEAQFASLDAQFEIAELSREATRQAREVSSAERQSFEMGQSSLLALNLREQAAISTYIEELDAVLEFQRAWVQLHELLGSDRVSDYLPPRGGLYREEGDDAG